MTQHQELKWQVVITMNICFVAISPSGSPLSFLTHPYISRPQPWDNCSWWRQYITITFWFQYSNVCLNMLTILLHCFFSLRSSLFPCQGRTTYSMLLCIHVLACVHHTVQLVKFHSSFSLEKLSLRVFSLKKYFSFMLVSGVRTYIHTHTHTHFCREVSMAKVHAIPFSCLLSNACHMYKHTQ